MAKERIARYEIQSEIGRGGMATVYLAYDPNFRRNVAIKLVAGNLQTEYMYRHRFEREAHLIAKIEHPAIVPVYDYGEYNNSLYLVMRYMPGGSLAGKIKQRILTLREASQIISQIAPALDAVHGEAIVHRDLKPGNILFDGFGNPAISDFGIAHFTSATSDLTGSAVIGTPTYMSPEQVRSDKELDGRSDIYALGVILFEMLTGHGPFQGTTPLSVAFKHLTDPIPSIRMFRPDLPQEVERVLNKALAKDRELRYSRASELDLDLRAIAETFHEAQSPPIIQPSNGMDAVTEVDTAETSQLDVPPQSVTGDSSRPGMAEVTPPESIDSSSPIEKPANRSVLKPLHVIAMAGLGLFLFLLCGSMGLFGTWAGLRGLFASPTQTLPPAPTQTSSARELVLFSDDFSDPNSGWPEGENAQGRFGYQPDGYHILVSGMDQLHWASTKRVHDNVSIHVDATPVTEGTGGYYGLSCRIQDGQNFYYFVIQGSGDYTIGKYKNAQFNSLLDGWRQSDAIRHGNQSNRLQADCTGNTLRFYVNDILVGEATDLDFTSGFSGILAASLEEQDFDVRFNQFFVRSAEQ
jgi:serine/threonine protein kinase